MVIIDMNNLLGDSNIKYTTNPKKADILFDFGTFLCLNEWLIQIFIFYFFLFLYK